MTDNGQPPLVAALDEFFGMVDREMTEGEKPLAISTADLAAFRNEKPAVEDEELNRVMQELKKPTGTSRSPICSRIATCSDRSSCSLRGRRSFATF